MTWHLSIKAGRRLTPAAVARLQEASPAAEAAPEDTPGAVVDPGHLRDVPRMSLHVGVLHYNPSLELCPLLADPLMCACSAAEPLC